MADPSSGPPRLRLIRPEPHAAQLAVLTSGHRFRVVFGGRRVGKTDMGIEALLIGTPELPGATRERGLYWWIGLTWRSASMKRAWRLLREQCRGWCEIREVEKEIRLPNGSEIWLRTAENLESLAGEGVRGCVMDEFTLMSQRVWTEYIRATLSDTGGWALFIGVPKGKNWSWELWIKGQEGGDPRWKSWQIPTSANPYIKMSEVEDARRDGLPELLFNQEYMAQVVDDAGTVFRNVIECATAQPVPRAVPGRVYIMGVDLAKLNDYTVCSVWDEMAKTEVWLERYNGVNYSVQKPRIAALAERFACTEVVVETNSMGEPIIEDLERAGVPVVRQTTTQSTKTAIIENMALAFEQRRLTVLADPTATFELQAYGMTRLPSGTFRYGAPEGLHDDTVMARAFAWSRIAAVGVSGRGWLNLFEASTKTRASGTEAA